MTITAGTPIAGSSSGLFAATDYAQLAATAWLEGVAACSWEFLIRVTARGHVMTIREEGSGNHRVSVVQMATGNIASATNCWRAYMTTATGFRAVETAANTAPLDTLQHVVVTYAAGALKLYINGVQDNTSTAGTGTGNVKTDGKPLRIGEPVDSAGGGFAGRLSRFWFYTRELSAVQVSALSRAKLDWTGFVGVGAEDAATDATAGPVAAPCRVDVTAQTDFDVLAKAYDPDGTLSLTAAGPGVNATVARQGTLVRVTPPTGSGSYTAPYTISDGTKTATSKIFGAYSPGGGDGDGVEGVDDEFDATTNVAIEIDPLANDIGSPDRITAPPSGVPDGHTVTRIDSNSRLRYRSPTGFTGIAAFSIVVGRSSDNAVAPAPSTVTMNVSAEPVAAVTWPSGLGNGSTYNTGANSYKTWLGREQTAAAGWSARKTASGADRWTSLDVLAGGASTNYDSYGDISTSSFNFWNNVRDLPRSTKCIWMYPLMYESMKTNQNKWAIFKTGGANASDWTTCWYKMGRRLANRLSTFSGIVYGNITVTLGWEMSQQSYPWCVSYNSNNAQQRLNYIECFQIASDKIKEGAEAHVSGGDAIKIEWRVAGSMTNGHTLTRTASNIYPGDAYVDVIGCSLHGRMGLPAPNWTANADGTPSDDWLAEIGADGSMGMDTVRRFAVSRGKKLGVDEWAVMMSTEVTDKGTRYVAPDPEGAIKQVGKYFKDHAGQIAHDCYMCGSHWDIVGETAGKFGQGATGYKAAFRQASPT